MIIKAGPEVKGCCIDAVAEVSAYHPREIVRTLCCQRVAQATDQGWEFVK